MFNFYNPTPPTDVYQAQSDSAVWMPYTQMSQFQPNLHIQRASGVTLYPTNHPHLIDAIASWWCVIHGYNHPNLNHAITRQLDSFAHIMLGGFIHDPILELAHTLSTITPGNLKHVFFSDSGSVGVEVAIKMALQYWRNQDQNRPKLAYLMGGYHGDTTGAMSVCDPIEGMHQLFAPLLPPHIGLPQPPAWGCEATLIHQYLNEVDSQLASCAHELAAVILEPICQCAGGFFLYDPLILKGIAEICNRYGILLIVDEVATGFGRLGPLFACELAGITPDIMVLGKGLTGGYLGLAATIATPLVFKGFFGGNEKALMHGPTFMGNALACAVANASIQECLKPEFSIQIQGIQSQLMALHTLNEYPWITSVRVLGAMGAFTFANDIDSNAIQKFAISQGVWLRPIGRVVYTSPASIMSDSELKKVIGVLIDIGKKEKW